MRVKLFLLFFFCSAFALSEGFSQRLEKNMLTQPMMSKHLILNELNGNIKEVKHNSYNISDYALPFDISLLSYNENPRSKYRYSYNRKRQVTSYTAQFDRYNKEEKLIKYKYSKEYTYEKSHLIRIDFFNYDTLYDSKTLENTYDSKNRLEQILQIDTSRNLYHKESMEYFDEFIKSTIVYNDTSTDINNIIYDREWNIISAGSLIKEKHIRYFNNNYYFSNGNLKGRISGNVNTNTLYYSGILVEYKYDIRGNLRKVKTFTLGGQQVGDRDKFWKRGLQSKVTYKEKIKDGVIMQRKTSFRAGKDRKKRTYSILDHKRNKILEISERGFLHIYKITYYD